MRASWKVCASMNIFTVIRNVRSATFSSARSCRFTSDHWYGAADTICLTAGVNDGKCVYGVPDPAKFGNSAKATEHAPSLTSLDVNVSKRFKITESKYVTFRSEFFNLPNHPSFSPPARNISTTTTFGAITGTSVGARTIQMALKFNF